MEKEGDVSVLALINEKRLTGEKSTPVEIITKMGVFDAREKAAEDAWLATGDKIIITLWAEFIHVGSGGHWFYLEPLTSQHRIGGGERSAVQMRRAKNRLNLVKFSQEEDEGLGLRAVLQTNRVAIAGLETDKAAKVSVRVPDDVEWHIASWFPERKFAVLVRGPKGWEPTEEEIQAALQRGGVPGALVEDRSGSATPQDVYGAAMEYLNKYFSGYGYRAETVSSENFGYDMEVSDKKGKTLLKLAVKGVAGNVGGFQMTPIERAKAGEDEQWRLAVVTDTLNSAAQHKLYRQAELEKVPGLEPEI